jgi:hypothetical protein
VRVESGDVALPELRLPLVETWSGQLVIIAIGDDGTGLGRSGDFVGVVQPAAPSRLSPSISLRWFRSCSSPSKWNTSTGRWLPTWRKCFSTMMVRSVVS